MKKFVSIILCALTLGLATSAQAVDVSNLRDVKNEKSALAQFAKDHPVLTKTIITVAVLGVLGTGVGLADYYNKPAFVKSSRLWTADKAKKAFGWVWNSNEKIEDVTRSVTAEDGTVSNVTEKVVTQGLGILNKAGKGIKAGAVKVWDTTKSACVSSKNWVKEHYIISSIAAAAIVVVGGITIDKLIRKEDSLVDLIYNKIVGKEEVTEEVTA